MLFGDIINAYTILVGNPEETEPSARPSLTQYDTIKNSSSINVVNNMEGI